MSSLIYPALPGLGFNFTRTPIWSTLKQQAVSGDETRVGLQAYPRYQYTLTYEFLRERAGLHEMQALLGFFNQVRGSFDNFSFDDPDDNSVSGQGIGIGDGATKTFQMARTLNGWVDPILAVKAIAAVYINGVVQAGATYSVDNIGLLTFTTAPGIGLPITADFTYYWRCRFVDDQYDFDKFMDKLWQMQQVQIITVKNEAP